MRARFVNVDGVLTRYLFEGSAPGAPARLRWLRRRLDPERSTPSDRLEASIGKLFANEMALKVTDLAMQLHGGYGFSREFPVERLLREARGVVLGGGPPQLQRNMIGDELLKRGLPSWV